MRHEGADDVDAQPAGGQDHKVRAALTFQIHHLPQSQDFNQSVNPLLMSLVCAAVCSTLYQYGLSCPGMDRPGVRQVPEGSGEQGKMEKTG